MKNTAKFMAKAGQGLLLAILILLSGCVVAADSTKTLGRSCVLTPDFADGGRLSMFLRLNRPDVPRVWMKIAAVEVLDGDTWIPLTGESIEIDTGKIGRGQIFIGRRKIPVGTCKALRFDLVKAALIKKDGRRVMLMIDDSSPTVKLLTPVEISLNGSESLFLSWDVESTLKNTVLAPPVLTVATSQSVPLISDLAYVSCPGIDTVYLFRTDRNWVHGSLAVAGEPRQMAIDSVNSRLYVLASKAGKILVIDLKTNRVLDRISLAMLQEPSFMALDNKAANAFVIDGRGNYLVRYDLAGGNLAARARIGQKINFIKYLPDQQRLAVSSTLDQSVYLVNPVDLTVQQQIQLNGVPQGLEVDGDTLYIAEEDANTVAVYDLATRRMLRRVRVGFGPYRIMLSNGEIFVSNRNSGGVSLFHAGQMSASRTLKGAAAPTELAASSRNHWLYVADEDSGGIKVFDATSKLPAGQVDLHAEIGDIEVLH